MRYINLRLLTYLLTLRETPPQKGSGIARVLKGSHSFTCTPHTRSSVHNRNEPYLPLHSQLIYRPRTDGRLS